MKIKNFKIELKLSYLILVDLCSLNHLQTKTLYSGS